MDRRRALSVAWLAATATIFLALELVLYRFVLVGHGLASIAYASLLQFFVLGISYDVATILMGILVSQQRAPQMRASETNAPAVAVVCTTCDDVDPDTLGTLRAQRYSNLKAFVLDDSSDPFARATADASGLHVVRRPNRDGYKAGNLNHWLSQHGHRFEFVVVADADSRLPADFVSEMVRYGLHPANEDVAVFESLIGVWNADDNQFAALQHELSPIHHRLALGLMNRTETTLSAGHNNLIRIRALREVGGFTTQYLAEDYATTVELFRRGWRCITVPVESSERAPANLVEYARREARWAYQMFQLGSLSTCRIPIPCRLRLAMALHFYGRSVAILVGFALIALSSIGMIVDNDARIMSAAFLPQAPLTLVLVVLPLFTHLALGRAAGIPLRRHLAAMLMHQALAVACAWPVSRRLALAVLRGDRLGFDRTGRTSNVGLRQVLAIAGGGVAAAWVAFLTALPVYLAAGVVSQLAWLLPAMAAPFILDRLQSREPQ